MAMWNVTDSWWRWLDYTVVLSFKRRLVYNNRQGISIESQQQILSAHNKLLLETLMNIFVSLFFYVSIYLNCSPSSP